MPGPIFANVVLADEINRATPKTQSALLEAMSERTASRSSASATPCREPFLVLATQNPLEYLGTFPLPESQLDRFLMHAAARLSAARRRARAAALGRRGGRPRAAATGDQPRRAAALQERVTEVRVAEKLAEYVLSLAEAHPSRRGVPARRLDARRAGSVPRRPGARALRGPRLRGARRRAAARPAGARRTASCSGAARAASTRRAKRSRASWPACRCRCRKTVTATDFPSAGADAPWLCPKNR